MMKFIPLADGKKITCSPRSSQAKGDTEVHVVGKKRVLECVEPPPSSKGGVGRVARATAQQIPSCLSTDSVPSVAQ